MNRYVMEETRMADLRSGWKILTADGRSPLQGGPSLLNGRFPVTLPAVTLDGGPEECAAGWNYVADIATGWKIAGMWPTGYPSRVVAVTASVDAIERGNKRRASTLTLLRDATTQELTAAIHTFSAMFGAHAPVMAREQLAWYTALGRPQPDVGEVEAQLALAVSARQLSWSLKRFDTAWDAWAARAALIVFFARLMGWQAGEPDQYIVGIRNAYHHGLARAIPVAPTVLGWAMER